MTPLHTEAEADTFLAGPGRRWLLKHSNTCPTSAEALAEVEAHLAAHPAPAALVVVQEARPLSNLLAVRLGRVHQSPQLFLLDGGTVRWSASHWSITASAMDQALNA